MVNCVKTYKKLIQIIERNRKSRSIKTNTVDTMDTLDLMELQHEHEKVSTTIVRTWNNLRKDTRIKQNEETKQRSDEDYMVVSEREYGLELEYPRPTCGPTDKCIGGSTSEPASDSQTLF